MTKGEITEQINDNLVDRFGNHFENENTIDAIQFMVGALGNFFTTDQLEEFYEFLKEE